MKSGSSSLKTKYGHSKPFLERRIAMLKKANVFIHPALHGSATMAALAKALWFIQIELEWGFKHTLRGHDEECIKIGLQDFNPFSETQEGYGSLWKLFSNGCQEGNMHKEAFAGAQRVEFNLTPFMGNYVEITVSYFKKGEKKAFGGLHMTATPDRISGCYSLSQS
jgi:hypothetical protein